MTWNGRCTDFFFFFFFFSAGELQVAYHATAAGQLTSINARAWSLRRYANPKMSAAIPQRMVKKMGQMRCLNSDGCPSMYAMPCAAAEEQKKKKKKKRKVGHGGSLKVRQGPMSSIEDREGVEEEWSHYLGSWREC